MEFRIAQDEFKTALSRVQGVVDKRNTMPLLSNVLIEALEGGQLRLTASDMEVAFTAVHEAAIKRPGEVCVAAKHLYEIIRQLPGDEVHVCLVENHWLEIRSGDSYFRIVGISPEGFPGIPTFNSTTSFQILGGDLSRVIGGVYFSIAMDDSRYGLNGAYLELLEESQGTEFKLISTDGHRMSMASCSLADNVSMSRGVLLPRKGLHELKKIADQAKDQNFQITLNENSGLFEWANTTFFMRFLEGEFPDYSQVVPQECARRVISSRGEMINALKRVSILSNEKTHSVRFTLTETGIELSASNQDLGESHERVSAEIEGEPMSIGFNAKYFLEALNVLDTKEVAIELGESLHPVLVKAEPVDKSLYIVMPMRLE